MSDAISAIQPAIKTLITDPAWMEPMLPEESNRELEDIAFELTSKASPTASLGFSEPDFCYVRVSAFDAHSAQTAVHRGTWPAP